MDLFYFEILCEGSAPDYTHSNHMNRIDMFDFHYVLASALLIHGASCVYESACWLSTDGGKLCSLKK